MTINGRTFYEMPCMCGVCPFFLIGGFETMGCCTLFEKHKSRYSHVPKRCSTLFDKAFKLGGDLVIVIKE